jgi:hypothetical protein
MHAYVFCPNFGSLDFGMPKFWFTIILVGQKLVANPYRGTPKMLFSSAMFLAEYSLPTKKDAILALSLVRLRL